MECYWCSVSSLAVDGNPNPNWHLGRSCSHTDTDAKNKATSWSVNLEGLYYLSWINIIPSMLNLYSAVVCCCYVKSTDANAMLVTLPIPLLCRGKRPQPFIRVAT